MVFSPNLDSSNTIQKPTYLSSTEEILPSICMYSLVFHFIFSVPFIFWPILIEKIVDGIRSGSTMLFALPVSSIIRTHKIHSIFPSTTRKYFPLHFRPKVSGLYLTIMTVHHMGQQIHFGCFSSLYPIFIIIKKGSWLWDFFLGNSLTYLPLAHHGR